MVKIFQKNVQLPSRLAGCWIHQDCGNCGDTLNCQVLGTDPWFGMVLVSAYLAGCGHQTFFYFFQMDQNLIRQQNNFFYRKLYPLRTFISVRSLSFRLGLI